MPGPHRSQQVRLSIEGILATMSQFPRHRDGRRFTYEEMAVHASDLGTAVSKNTINKIMKGESTRTTSVLKFLNYMRLVNPGSPAVLESFVTSAISEIGPEPATRVEIKEVNGKKCLVRVQETVLCEVGDIVNLSKHFSMLL